jgi:glycosyltransferase involved in cell wall biosynthesis
MPNRQRVWIISELYYPELTSTGYFLTGIAEGLASASDVRVLCGQPSYWARGVRAASQEMLNGVDVHRCWATRFDKNKAYCRLLNLFTISVTVFSAALFGFRRHDIAIVVTNPPLLPYLIAVACRLKNARFVLLVHDVYPEVFMRLRILDPESVFARFMNRASRRLYRSANRIIVLGRDMQDLVSRKLEHQAEKVIIATNWGDTDLLRPQPPSESRLLQRLGLQGRFVIQYCGNIGRSHGIKDLVEAAERLSTEPDFHFLLIGWGARKKWAIQQKEKRSLQNLTILNPLPQDEFCDALNACDLAIISFSAGMAGISVPSRMYNVMAAGKPLLAVCDDESELAAVVKEERIGWVVPPDRPDLIASTLLEAKSDRGRLKSMGQRARQAAETKYTKGHVLKVYQELIDSFRSA